MGVITGLAELVLWVYTGSNELEIHHDRRELVVDILHRIPSDIAAYRFLRLNPYLFLPATLIACTDT